MERNKQGKVYLVGAGPGDPGLLTIKAKECLEKADVVIYDYLANEAFLNYAGEEAELIYVGKKGGAHTMPQEEINELILDKARKGYTVVRLKGGDPFIFGRGGDSVQLDPAIVTDGESFRVTGQCLEPLYQYEHGTTKPVPALATECTPNEDGTEWTCALREGVTFHDGATLDANDVVRSWEAGLNAASQYHTGNTGAFTYPSYLFDALMNLEE